MYIGVTGFTNRSQVEDAIVRIPWSSERLLMVGVLASYKTIQGQPAGNPKRYPRREDIADIFDDGEHTLNLVHYNTRDQSELAAQLWGALEWGGPHCDGIQLNIVWPDPKVVRGLRASNRDVFIVLQLNQGAMAECGNSAGRAAEVVGEKYGDAVDYVLVDSSGGRGEPLDPYETIEYFNELYAVREHRGQSFEVLVAGGLCAENLEEILNPLLFKLEPRFGIDAEGALRTDDNLDSQKVARYLDVAYNLFS